MKRWDSEHFKRYSDMVTAGIQCVENLVYKCGQEGLHVCCHILTAIARLQHAFLTVNKRVFEEMAASIAILCEELTISVYAEKI